MLKHLTPVLLCGVLLSACAPGPVLRSPAIVGMVTDARTHFGLPGARVSVEVPGEGSPANPLPDTVSDAQGHFSLEARYAASLMVRYGDPGPTPITVHFSKEGYGEAFIHTSYNLRVPPYEALHEDAELTPDAAPAHGQNRANHPAIL